MSWTLQSTVPWKPHITAQNSRFGFLGAEKYSWMVFLDHSVSFEDPPVPLFFAEDFFSPLYRWWDLCIKYYANRSNLNYGSLSWPVFFKPADISHTETKCRMSKVKSFHLDYSLELLLFSHFELIELYQEYYSHSILAELLVKRYSYHSWALSAGNPLIQ